MKLNFILILLIANFCERTSQQKSLTREKTISVEQLKADINQLQIALLKYHPGVDRHVPMQTILSGFAKANESLTVEMTDWEFYRLVAPLVASLQCGHTRTYPSSEMQAQLSKIAIYFPLKVTIASSRLYMLLPDNKTEEILEINGEQSEKIVRKIFSSYAIDGPAEEPKEDTQSFGKHYAQYINHNPDEFNLIVRQRNKSQTEKIVLYPITAKEYKKLFPKEIPIEFHMQYDIGYLKVNTFSSEDYSENQMNYTDFLENAFSQLNKNNIPKLIVDIRGNGGGDDQYGAILISYLSQKPFEYFKRVYKKKGNDFVPVDHPCKGIQYPNVNVFKGKICMLINGRTFSTAADVASVFKSNNLGIVLGRETGGGYEGNTSGATELITLENSKINIHIPMWFYENAVVKQEVKNRGVIPDIKIPRQPYPLFQNESEFEIEVAVKTLNK